MFNFPFFIFKIKALFCLHSDLLKIFLKSYLVKIDMQTKCMDFFDPHKHQLVSLLVICK